MTAPTDPTRRFSSRVVDYLRYRPGYPGAVIGILQAQCGLTPACIVADIGSGTGLLAELFLRNGNVVFGVEPNPDMRAAGERHLARYASFRSVAAKAEATTMGEHSIDVITAGQAFHWFDPAATRREFERILRPGGWVVLVWNERETESSAFLRAYERLLLRFSTDYTQVDHRRIDERVLARFFSPGRVRLETLSNRQDLDLVGLKGRLLSSSYAPEPGHPDHEGMLMQLSRIFDEYQSGGKVAFEYTTKVYFGRLTE
jgi:SAM-dependent methyltransferase